MPQIDKQECPSIFDAKPSDVAKLNKLKKKLSLILIASNILSLLSIYKSLQYELTKSLSYMSNIYKTLIDYFRLLIIARHNCIIVTYINLNTLKHRIIKLLKKQSCSQL